MELPLCDIPSITIVAFKIGDVAAVERALRRGADERDEYGMFVRYGAAEKGHCCLVVRAVCG